MAHNIATGGSSALDWTGRRALRLSTYPLDLGLFIFHVLRRWLRHGGLRVAARRREMLIQVLRAAADPLPAVLLLGFVTGFTFALPLLMISPQLAENELGPVLLRVIGFELGTLLTAVVLIGRAGRAMAVNLALMQLSGKTEELARHNDLYDSFIAPRLLGSALAQLVLATCFTTVALFGGMLLAGLLQDTGPAGLIAAILEAVEIGDLTIFIVKNLLFGFLVAGTACHSALQVKDDVADVAERAQQAATAALLLVFVIDAAITLLSV